VPLFVPPLAGIQSHSVRKDGTKKPRFETRSYWSNSLRTIRCGISANKLLTGGLLVRIQPEEPIS